MRRFVTSLILPPAACDTTFAAPSRSNQYPPTTAPVPRGSVRSSSPKCLLPASQNFPRPISYNSTRNATASIVSTQLVRITHPFHPFRGRQLVCVGERYNR